MLSLPFNPFSALTSKIFGATTLALAMALALSHCSDKRHTRQRDEARKAAKKRRRDEGFKLNNQDRVPAQRLTVSQAQAR